MLKVIRKNIKAFIWLVVAIFSLFGLATVSVPDGAELKHAAKIGKSRISVQEYEAFYNTLYYSPRFQNALRSGMAASENFLMETTLNYIALYHEAKKRNIFVSDTEVKDEIFLRFSNEGFFRNDLYQGWVKRFFRGKPRSYEEGVRKELTVQKLIDTIFDSVTVEETSIRRAFDLENNTYDIQYLLLKKEDFNSARDVSPQELATYYNLNQEKFKTPDKYGMSYIFFDTADYLNDVSLTREEIDTAFNVIASSASKETDLKHLRKQIERKLQLQKAKEKAVSLANDVRDMIQEKKDFSAGVKLAGKSGFQTGLQTAEKIAGLLSWNAEAIAKLKTMEAKTLHTVTTNSGAYVVLLSDREHSRLPPFAKISDNVKKAFLADFALSAATDQAAAYIEELRDGNQTFDALANKIDAKLQQYSNYNAKLDTLPGLQKTTALTNQLIELNSGDFLPPFQSGESLVILQLVRKNTESKETYLKQRDFYESRLLKIKANSVTNAEIQSILAQKNIENYLNNKKDPFSHIK